MPDAGTDETQRRYRLMYRSHSKIAADERDAVLAQIFDAARSKNAKIGVTGALLVTDHWFVQVLEGEESTVSSLYQRISQDDRHDDVKVIESGAVDSLVFSRWSMARVSSSGHADIPLHATDGHADPAAAQSITREQSVVLKAMRNTIGADTV